MAVSARLGRDIEAALKRFCKANKLTKTEAIELGIGLLCQQKRGGKHPAFVAYQGLKLVAEDKPTNTGRSSDRMRTAIRAKYSD
jgi:hypothetical protein